MNTQTIEGIRLGNLLLDTGGRRLIREGKRVSLGPLEFKLLETLVQNRGRVLTGDELRILVWADDPSRQVLPAQDGNALYVSIRKLRAALGESGKWIVNIPKVGYTISNEVKVEKLATPASDLPTDVTPFVGREGEITQISDSLLRSRLVTLTGAPGVGKTRLAKEAARALADKFDLGIRFIDLTTVLDGQFVEKAVMTALELPDSPGRDLRAEFADFLGNRSIGLIFDNCEHVIDSASALIEDLCRAGRNVHIIATSREPLLLPDETVVMVRPLNVPPSLADLPRDHLMAFDAVRLFIELAKQRRPDMRLSDRDLPFVAELCRQLEGIPVALELAAVQVDAYPIDQIVTLMADRVRMLQRRGGRASRHKTLEAAIDWSYGLLSPQEKLLFNRLSVFVGGWTLDIAKNACADGEISEGEVLHLLAGLVRRSLVQTVTKKGLHRYRMLEMIRQFGLGRLEASGELEMMLERRTAAYVDLAQRSFDDGDRGNWPAIIETEYDNIRAVLTRTVANERDIVSGLRLSGSLSRFWFNHGHLNEALHWTELALSKDDRSDPEASARCLMAAGFFFGQMPGSEDDAGKRRVYFEESIKLWRELDDRRNLGVTLIGYAFMLNRLGEYNEAIKAAEESLDMFRGTEFRFNASRAANNLALTLLDIGEFDRAKGLFEEALEDSRLSDDAFLEAVCLHNMGDVALQTGELDAAVKLLDESIAKFKLLEQRPLIAGTTLLRSEVDALQAKFKEAFDRQIEALLLLKEIGDNHGIAAAFEAIATTLALQNKRPELALTFRAAARARREKIDVALSPARTKRLNELMKKVKAAVGKNEAAKAEAKGTDLSVEKAIGLIRTLL